MYFIKICELPERVFVTERDEDEAVVREGGDRVRYGHFLPATGRRGAHEDAGILSVERPLRPELARRVPKGLVTDERW